MTQHQAPLETATVAVTGNFTIQATLPQGKTVTFSGYLYDKESIESVNQRLDLLHDAVDRQRTRAEIPELEVVLENRLEQLGQLKHHYGVLIEARDKNNKLTTQQKGQLDVMDTNLAKLQQDIDAGKVKIAAARAAVGK